LKTKISPLNTDDNRNHFISSDMSLVRYQWDLLYRANLATWVCDNLYSYLNDSQIQTALNKIIPSLEA